MKDIQDKFLSRLQVEHQNVTLITVNGFQAHGQITGHDRYGDSHRQGRPADDLQTRHLNHHP